MDKKDSPEKVIQLLMTHEEKIGKLYHIYANNYPDQAEFWERLSVEECGHAALLNSFRARIEKGEALFNREHLSPQAVQTSVEHIEHLLKEAMNKERPLVGALQAAYDIEQGLVEMDYYKILEGDVEEVAAIFHRISMEEKHHRMQVQERLFALTGRRT